MSENQASMTEGDTTENTFTLDATSTPGISHETLSYSTIAVLQITIGIVGVISNATVVLVFGTNKKFRMKTPIKFIINQVSTVVSNEHLFSSYRPLSLRQSK